MMYSSLPPTIRNRVPSGKRDQSDAALITWRPERYFPSAFRRPPLSVFVYAVVRTFIRRALAAAVVLEAAAGPCAQLASKEAAATTIVRVKNFGICTAAPISIYATLGKKKLRR